MICLSVAWIVRFPEYVTFDYIQIRSLLTMMRVLEGPNGHPQPQRPEELSQHIAKVKSLIPNVKSALFLPLWDFDRKRWFAGCFCWSTRVERNLSGPLELPFLKTFGHSIMQELARVDAMTTNQVKTTFLSSLSHELRSPLVRFSNSEVNIESRLTLRSTFSTGYLAPSSLCEVRNWTVFNPLWLIP